jgi:hypothetical protein
MEYLYNLDSKGSHVKFFKWCWGIDPTIRYKTMCPYFWALLGTIIIFPVIVLAKLVNAAVTPWLD